VIADALKLSVYFGDSATAGSKLASAALMQRMAERDVKVAALFRGVEGFGIHRRIHAGRFPDVSTDLPLLAMAVDERARIEALLADVDEIVSQGLVTLEHARLATGDDVAEAGFPEAPGRVGKLTIYLGRTDRANGKPAFRHAVDVLRGLGAEGAIVLMGVDGVLRGRRREARLFSANADSPLMIISVGSREVLQRALPALKADLHDPVVTVEPIEQLKRDGRLLAPLPNWERHETEELEVWHTLRVYTRRSAQVGGRPLYSELTRRLREAGAAGATTILGEWGFSSDELPYGDRFGRLASHAPSYTVYIDRPAKVAQVWPIVDELTAEHGIVTWLVVPGYRERAGDTVHGHLRLARPPIAHRLADEAAGRSGESAGGGVAGESSWVGRFNQQVAAFALERGRHEPLVRVTLTDGEQFFLASLDERPGEGLVTLYPHPESYEEMIETEHGRLVSPRAVIVSPASILKLELLADTPRGTRSLVGYRMRFPGG
jgi:PII-like signaling protein